MTLDKAYNFAVRDWLYGIVVLGICRYIKAEIWYNNE